MNDKHQLLLVIHGDPMNLITLQQYLSQLRSDANGAQMEFEIVKMEIKPLPISEPAPNYRR